MQLPVLLWYAFLAHLHLVNGLRIGSSLLWIEHTPQPYAIRNFYNGTTPATLISGGVADLASNKTFDLAANAETQGLIQYVNHRDIRLIYIICEVGYRIVADKRRGISKLEDLKGKKIGTFRNTSAEVFIHNMMSSVDVKDSEYSLVNAFWCMKEPCAEDTLPHQLKSGAIDAFGIWETSVELGIKEIGDNAVIFQNTTLYREVYSLYSTTAALGDKKKRKDIVEFVRSLNKTLDVFTHQPKAKGIYDFVAKEVGSDANVVEDVWADHKWSGTWDDSLIDYLVDEDKYLAGQDNRTAIPRADLEKFLDRSIIDEL